MVATYNGKLTVNPGRIVYGIAALAVPLGFVVFGLLMAAITGWRRWFDLPSKKEPPEDEKK